MSSSYDPETISIPTEVAFDVLEKLRLVTVYLDPPEDFKPHKWPEPEVYAAEDIYPAYKALFAAMAKSMGNCAQCGRKLGECDHEQP